MEAKTFIFSKDGHEHRVIILRLFPPTQKQRDETVADPDEKRTVKYRTHAEEGVNSFEWLF